MRRITSHGKLCRGNGPKHAHSRIHLTCAHSSRHMYIRSPAGERRLSHIPALLAREPMARRCPVGAQTNPCGPPRRYKEPTEECTRLGTRQATQLRTNKNAHRTRKYKPLKKKASARTHDRTQAHTRTQCTSPPAAVVRARQAIVVVVSSARGRLGTRAKRATSPRLHAPRSTNATFLSALASLTRPLARDEERRSRARSTKKRTKKNCQRGISRCPLRVTPAATNDDAL